MDVNTERQVYTKEVVLESLKLAQKTDGIAEIVGNRYLSRFMREQVL